MWILTINVPLILKVRKVIFYAAISRGHKIPNGKFEWLIRLLRQKKMVSNVICVENSKFKFQDPIIYYPTSS